MSGQRPLQVVLRLDDDDAAARQAYNALYPGLVWAQLPEHARNTWRKIAHAVLAHVEVVGR